MVDALFRPVTPHGEALMDEIAAQPGRTLLALDFDGTLAGMVPDPEDSRLHDGSAAALARLGSLFGQVAIITGRPVETVRRLGRLDERDGLDNLVVLGQYGVERYDAATGQVQSLPVNEGIEQAKAELEQLLVQMEKDGWNVAGVHLEDKGIAVGVHTRRAADPQGAFEVLGPFVARIAEELGLQVEPGRLVIEVRASSRSKGDALSELVKEIDPRVVVMAGDDLGDLPAFEHLGLLRQSGLSCAAVVSSSEEQPQLRELADVVCDGPDGVAAWLSAVADRLEKAG